MRIEYEGAADTRFRTPLERRVADELTRLEVRWEYRHPVLIIDDWSEYPPSFTIGNHPSYLELPPWLTCVNQEDLYLLRDHLDVTRQAGEYFQEDVTVQGVNAETLSAYGLDDLADAKNLMEQLRVIYTAEAMLVVGAVGGTNRLSASFYHDKIVFSRYHPFVNHPGYLKRVKKARREKEIAASNERREQERKIQQKNQQQARDNEMLYIAINSTKRITPKFSSKCYGCNDYSQTGMVWGGNDGYGYYRWNRICPECAARIGV